MIVAIELDGIICTPVPNYMALTEVDQCKLLPNAKESLDKIVSLGHRILIYTSRDASLGPATEVWLQKNKVPYNNILCNKPRYDLAIDNRVHKFIDWATALETNKYILNNLR